MKTAEIVIIGGGVVGASIAYHLSERGVRDILILERESEQGKGSTGKATGGVRAQFETDINILLSLYSLEFFANCHFDCGYEPAGYLFFATTQEQLDYLERNVATQSGLGVRDVSLIDTDAIREIVPGMNCEDVLGGTFGARDGFIDPLAVMRGFSAGAFGRGAKIAFNSPVLSINVVGGKIRSVTTPDQVIECGKVILCTGAWARELAATAGIELPVQAIRRQIVWGRCKNDLPDHLPMVIDIGTGFHFRPARDFNDPDSSKGRSRRDILFAYPDPAETPSATTSFDDAFIGKVYERARHRAAFLGVAEVVREKCRAGLYEVTPDHHAVLGDSGVAGLYLANGFSGHGVMHSPATGRALSEIIVDGTCSFMDISSLHIDRFAEGKLLHETAFI